MALPLDILVYGFGNPGRQDDGLGILFADWAESLGIPGLSVETNYQLNAEDALEISTHDVVVFADASENDVPGIRLSELAPAGELAFSTHAMSPGAVLALCSELYGRAPCALLLEIRGHAWDFAEGVSSAARANLERAKKCGSALFSATTVDGIRNIVENGVFHA